MYRIHLVAHVLTTPSPIGRWSQGHPGFLLFYPRPSSNSAGHSTRQFWVHRWLSWWINGRCAWQRVGGWLSGSTLKLTQEKTRGRNLWYQNRWIQFNCPWCRTAAGKETTSWTLSMLKVAPVTNHSISIIKSFHLSLPCLWLIALVLMIFMVRNHGSAC